MTNELKFKTIINSVLLFNMAPVGLFSEQNKNVLIIAHKDISGGTILYPTDANYLHSDRDRN